MDLSKLLRQLRSELEHLDAAIHSLEELEARGERRGSPPKALAEMRRQAKAENVRPRRAERKNLSE